jgi:hypothetical protein
MQRERGTFMILGEWLVKVVWFGKLLDREDTISFEVLEIRKELSEN